MMMTSLGHVIVWMEKHKKRNKHKSYKHGGSWSISEERMKLKSLKNMSWVWNCYQTIKSMTESWVDQKVLVSRDLAHCVVWAQLLALPQWILLDKTEEVGACVVSDAEMREPMLHVGIKALIRVAGFDMLEIRIVHASLCARWKGVVLLQLVLTGQKMLESRHGHGGWEEGCCYWV